MFKNLLAIVVMLFMSSACVFESGPELSSIPPFSPLDSSNHDGSDQGDVGTGDAGDMMRPDMPVDMDEVVDAPADMPTEPDLGPDMPPDMADEPDMMLPGPYGDVCPGPFMPPPTGSESCDLILQNCPPGPEGEGTNCDLALISAPPDPEFGPRCLLDQMASFTIAPGGSCDPASDDLKCQKGLECSQINFENRCRRFCILEDARGCDSVEVASFCASTGLGPLDSNGIGYCASSCDAFQ